MGVRLAPQTPRPAKLLVWLPPCHGGERRSKLLQVANSTEIHPTGFLWKGSDEGHVGKRCDKGYEHFPQPEEIAATVALFQTMLMG